MRPGILLGLCGVLVTAGGCAFTQVPLDMPVSGLATPLRGGNGRQVVVVEPFADQRPEAYRCGMQKNGYNQDTAAAVCRMPPDQWIAELLADELRAAGFAVLAPDAERNPNTLVVDGTLLQLFVEPVPGAWVASCEADEVLGEIVSAVIALADRYPQLGTCAGGPCGR